MRLAACALLLAARPASAFEFFDGRLTVHGYVGVQLRALGNNLDTKDNIDLSQWYNILNVEVESNLLPNGWGPIEIATFYSRIELRYDCMWSHACELSDNVNVYGNNAEHLPKRLIDAHLTPFSGQLENGDDRPYAGLTRETYQLGYRDVPLTGRRSPLTFENVPGIIGLFGNGKGPNQKFDPITKHFGDDPPPYYFFHILDRCLFAAQETRGPEDGNLTRTMGPWNPRCKIEQNGALRNFPNPFNIHDFIPILAGPDRIPNTGDEPINPGGLNPGQPIAPYGNGALPFRPAPFWQAADRGAPRLEAQGIYYPSDGFVRAERTRNHLDDIDQNFSQTQLEFNHGASQQETYELKEAYVDLEFFEGRLWMRLGKQTIVWGKTELFRNTDQFNPQDFALSSLPSLEESRIALWSARGTWSFYNIGKFEDVRLELAVNLDKYQPADLGRCGEPYAFDVICSLSFGYFAHGLAGAGLAGNDKPPSPWEDVKGLEGGGRLEWRYQKFSFQLSDFYGYDDFPHPVRISTFERNVDPDSGRPRRYLNHGPCTTGFEPACLGNPNALLRGPDGYPLRAVNGMLSGHTGPNRNIYNVADLIVDPNTTADILANHYANQQAFAFGSIDCGVAGLNVDPAICGLASINSKQGPGAPLATVANGFSALLAGSQNAVDSATGLRPYVCTYKNVVNPVCRDAWKASLVLINHDPGDGLVPLGDGGLSLFRLVDETLGQNLTPQQLALLGCGPYYQSDCDQDGVDLLNAEASVLVQSWPGFEGTSGTVFGYDVRNGSFAGPGTMGYRGGPVATRFVAGKLVMLPGARGPLDANYNPLVDGCVSPAFGGAACAGAHPLTQPYTGQLFRSEMATVSWNMMNVFVSRSDALNPDLPTQSDFDPNDPFGTGVIRVGPNAGQLRPGVTSANGVDPTSCGFFKPQLCHTVQDFLSSTGVSRNSVRAAGNGEFGRRDFAWQSGGEFVLGYAKHNVLGFAFDFAEDHTKSNWGVEASWVNRQPYVDNNSVDNISYSDTFNLTVSIDRPTFINFLNQNRTFFFNTQFFIQYINGYNKGYLQNGPFNFLGTFTVLTGYHQDRLLVQYTAVYDVQSSSGALLPQLTYRFTEAFSATIGVNLFFGRQQFKVSAINEVQPGIDRVGSHAYDTAVENGLSVLRTRDEIFTTLRYTF
jgi:hypothetical protein